MTGKAENRMCRLLVTAVLVTVVVGCSMFKPKLSPPEAAKTPSYAATTAVKPPTQKSAHLIHQILWPGETLSIIAKWYTGDYRNWPALVEATPWLVNSRVAVGDKVLIPDHLVTNRSPLPKTYLARYHRQEPSSPQSKKPEAVPESSVADMEPEVVLMTPEAQPQITEEEYHPVPFGPKSYLLR